MPVHLLVLKSQKQKSKLLCHCNHNEFHIIWFTLMKSALSIVRTISVSYKADFITIETRGTTWILLCQERKFWNIQPILQNLYNILANFLSIKQVIFPQSVFLLGICAHYELGPDFYILIWSKGNNSMTFFSKRKWNDRDLPCFSFSMGNINEYLSLMSPLLTASAYSGSF